MKRFQYYQPNKKDLKDQYADCTIRALSKALNVTWIEAFDLMMEECRKEQCVTIFSLPLPIRKRIMDSWGFDYQGVSVANGKRRPTIAEFAKAHPTGTFICNVAGHEVAIVDGMYYDTWDSGYKPMYGYFIKRGN